MGRRYGPHLFPGAMAETILSLNCDHSGEVTEHDLVAAGFTCAQIAAHGGYQSGDVWKRDGLRSQRMRVATSG